MLPHASTSALSLSMRQLVLYFLKLGTIGFGGPAVLVGYVRQDLVDDGQRIETLATELGAHTLACDAARSKVYAFLPQTHRVAVYVDRG